MARKIQKNQDIGPEGLSEAWFPITHMNVETSTAKSGEEMVVITFTCTDGEGNPCTMTKHFMPFHSESTFPRHIWNTFARGMGSVGYAPKGGTCDQLAQDSEHWLMPDRLGCKEESDNHGQAQWQPINFDWGEPAGPAELYEPVKVAPPPAAAQEEPPPPIGDDLPF